MPLKDKVDDVLDSYVRSGHQPHEITPEFYKEISENETDGRLLKISPYPENEGMEASEEFLQSVHDLRPSMLGLKNQSKTYGFEIWFTGGKIQFFFFAPDETTEKKFRKQLDAEFPQAKIIEKSQKFPDLYEQDYVAGSELELKRSNYYPIKSSRGVREFIHDPYRLITSDMVSKDENRVFIQILFKPALHSWTKGGPLGGINPWQQTMEDTARSLKQDKLTEGVGQSAERKATREERNLAQVIATQEGLPAYHANIRVLTISPYPGEARSNAWSIAKTFEQSYQEAGDQTLVQRPLNGKFLREMVVDMSARELVQNGMTLTVPELAAVAHVPNESIQTPAVQWNYTQTGGRLPAEAERFQPSADGDGKRLRGAQTGSDDLPLQLKDIDEEDAEFKTIPENETTDNTEDQSMNETNQSNTQPVQNEQQPMNEMSAQKEATGIFPRIMKMLGLGYEGEGLQPEMQERRPGDVYTGNVPQQPQGQPPQQPQGQPPQQPQGQPPQQPQGQQNPVEPGTDPAENDEPHPLETGEGVPAGVDPADVDNGDDDTETEEESDPADPWDDDDEPSPFDEDIPAPGDR